MSGQDASQIVVRVSFALILSLSSLSAFSEGHNYIEFSVDTDDYTVKAGLDPLTTCVKDVNRHLWEYSRGTRL